MNLRTIFHFEWLQLRRQPALFFALIVFFLIGCYAIYSGRQTTYHQKTVIDTLKRQYVQDYDLALKKFTDTLSPEAKAQASYAGLPQMINFRIPPLAINAPQGLATLSVGQRDVNPYYQKVKSSVNFLDNENVELSNPFTLFTGNFDLAFVLVYLLPLLIIALCYNVFAEELEKGTYALLRIQSQGVFKVINAKLAFRLVLAVTITLLLSLLGFWVSSGIGQVSVTGIMLWCYASLLYVGFWVSVCYFVVQLKRNAVVSALSLLGIWLFFLVLLPSLANTYVAVAKPTPLRADLASYQRHVSEEIWSTKPQLLADTFNRNNPQYNSTINPAKDSTRNGERFVVAYYDLLERKVSSYAKKIDQEIRERNRLSDQISLINPSVSLQYLYNEVAHSGRADYLSFQQQISQFQRVWRHHLYQRQLAEINFKKEELAQLPKFKREVKTNLFKVMAHSVPIWVALFLFLFLGLWAKKIIN